MPWLLAARRKKHRHLLLLLLLKLRPLLLRLLMQSRLTPLLLLTLPSRLTPLLRLLMRSLLTLPLRPLMQSRLKPLRPSNLRIIFGKNRSQDRFFFVPSFVVVLFLPGVPVRNFISLSFLFTWHVKQPSLQISRTLPSFDPAQTAQNGPGTHRRIQSWLTH
ncbi:hypothetical protein JOD78_003581 [Herbaspirillum sp. 1130]|nr:hypothetical protein [Herbaspirillum sp. 1130]